MRKVELDWKEMQEPETAHSHLKMQFGFPDYYGGNLDALYDCLTEICEDTLVEIHNPEVVHDSEMNPDTGKEYVQKLYQVFWDAQEENPFLRFLF